MTMLDAALVYAARGWAVFPCRPGQKVPATPHGCKDATNDTQRISNYWTLRPTANIGIACGELSGLLVLDLDRKNGVDGLQTLAAIEARHGKLPHTLTATSPTGGVHIYLRHRAGLGNTAGRLGPGIDTRGEGGYVLAAPSETDAGVYEWLDDLADAPIAEPPAWLVELLTNPQQKTARREGRTASLQPIPPGIGGVLAHLARQGEGHRNDNTFWAAMRLFERGVPHGEAEQLIGPIAAAIGLDDREIAATIRSAYRGAT